MDSREAVPTHLPSPDRRYGAGNIQIQDPRSKGALNIARRSNRVVGPPITVDQWMHTPDMNHVMHGLKRNSSLRCHTRLELALKPKSKPRQQARNLKDDETEVRIVGFLVTLSLQ